MSCTPQTFLPFKIDPAQANPLLRMARPGLERVLKFGDLNNLYHRIIAGGDAAFEDKALEQLGVTIDIPHHQLRNIPTTGRLVIVANHPFGGIEGMILASLIRRVRPDVRLMANYMLSVITELRDLFIFVDPFDSPGVNRRNIRAMREAIQWVEQGGALGVFPAVEVSHWNYKQQAVMDPPWHDAIARIIQRTQADALPVFFDGCNSRLFQIMGMVHPRLRTLMLPHELFKRQGRRVRACVGSVTTYKTLARYQDPKQITAALRLRTYHLKPSALAQERSGLIDDAKPIALAEDAQQLACEIQALSQDQKLLSQGDFDVVIGRSAQFPVVMAELGRLREIAFRQVGEGTGQPRDLDRFDPHYLHLVVWHRTRRTIVGAYRLGLTDEILKQFGRRGLYTSTLFHFRRPLLDQISPAIEMGRSFVHLDYQKNHTSLMLLWRGIGEFLSQRPRYRYLFGPVSISADYTSMSKHLLMAFLKLHKSLPSLGRWLRPRNPPKMSPTRDYDAAQFSRVVDNLSQVNDLVRELVADGKPIPVLLRQYLSLNGVLLGFNVDRDFGDVLDGLILIDIMRIDHKVIRRYMGKEAAKIYLAYHSGEKEN